MYLNDPMVTLSDVGLKYHMTRERVRQIVSMEYPDYRLRKPFGSAKHHKAMLRTQERVDAAREQVVEVYQQCGSIYYTADAVGVSKEIVREVVRSLSPEDHYAAKAYGHTQERIYSHQDLLNLLRENPEAAATSARWKAAGLSPTCAIFLIRFGTWRRALELAGLPTTEALVTRRSDWISPQEVFDAVMVVARRLGYIPTYAEYDLHRDPSMPSPATVRNRYGTWSQLKLDVYRALNKTNRPPNSGDTGGT